MKLLFLHGLGQTKESWKETIQALKGIKTACVQVIDPNVRNQTFSSLADRMEQQLLEEKEQVVLCGLSLGAVVALEMYFRQPNKIAGLILIAAQYKMPTRLIDLQNLIFKLMPNKLFTKIGISKEEMVSISSSMRSIDYSEKINEINCFVYVLCGNEDRANKKASIALHELLPQSKLSIIANAGHTVNEEQPGKLAEVIWQAYMTITKTR